MTTPFITISPIRHGMDIMADTAKVCPCCQRLAWWWRNRDGRTTCIDCAKEEPGTFNKGVGV
jgi:hypothetical protein